MYHGAHTKFQLHVGLCLTDNRDTASNYADRGELATVEINMAALRVLRSAVGYDRETNIAPGDSGETYDADVLTYDDEDEYGRQHITYRLLTARSLDACKVVTIETLKN